MADSDITIVGLQAVGGVNQILLSWAIDDPNADGLTYLRFDHADIYASDSADMSGEAKIGEASNAFVELPIAFEVTRYYQVVAIDRSDRSGERSVIVSGGTFAELSTGALSVVDVSNGQTGIVVTVSAGGTGFSIVHAGGGVAFDIDMSAGGSAFQIGSDGGGSAIVATCAGGGNGVSITHSGGGNGIACSRTTGGGYNFWSSNAVGFAYYAAVGGYGPFTGAHEVLIRGTVEAEIGDVLCDVEIVAHRDISNAVSIAERSSKALQRGPIGVLAGVLQREADDVLTRVVCNALGEGLINVCGEGGSIAAGDLLVTSSLPGKAMRQDDDVVRALTVARAREAASFASSSKAQIACIYLCG